MDAVVYKLLTHDKQALVYFIDNTNLICEAKAVPDGTDFDIFSTALTFTCLLHGIFINTQRISVKIESTDPLAFMAFGADANGDVQGFASDVLIAHHCNGLKKDSGCIKIIRDNGAGAVSVGIVELQDDDITQNFSRYFLQSEQTQMVFRYFTDKKESETSLSRGILAQALPFADKALIADWENRLEAESGAVADAEQTVETLLKTVFKDASVVEKRPVRLRCSCGRQKVIEMLAGLGAGELEWTIGDNDDIEVKCGKCANRYSFGAEEIRSLMGRKEG